LMEDGLRIYIECGYLAPSHLPREKFWVDNRLAVFGTHGYVWGETDGRWAMLTPDTRGQPYVQQDDDWRTQHGNVLQPLYLADFAEWLDDDTKVHPCNVEISYHGYEILEAVCISAIEKRRVDLPLDVSQCRKINESMSSELPDCLPLKE